MIDFSLTAEQLALQKRAREFALKEILPVVNYFDEQDVFPQFLLKRCFDAGLLNPQIPKKFGGPEYGLVDCALIVEEFAAACSGMATSLFDNTLGSEPVILSSNEFVKEKYLTEMAKNFKTIAFATSEPMMGSDVGGIRCLAEKDGDDYLLTGTKYWITNGGYADYCSIFASSDPKSRNKGIGVFFVDLKTPGVTIGEHIPKMGMRTSNTVAVKLDHVRVPKECILAEPGGPGFKLAMKTFARTRPIIGAFAVGAMRSAMEFAIDYSKKRRAFGAKLEDFQAIQFKIAEMYQKVETARLLTYKCGWEADMGMDPTVSASMTKFYATEMAWDVVSSALQIFGGYGYTKMFPLEKILRDVRVLMVYEGTSEVQRIVVSRHALNDYKPVMPPLEDLVRLKADNVEEAAREGLKNQVVWRCRICGHYHYGPEPPEECPYCRFPKAAFKKIAG
jgi:acyl-CoA dehydrogenase